MTRRPRSRVAAGRVPGGRAVHGRGRTCRPRRSLCPVRSMPPTAPHGREPGGVRPARDPRRAGGPRGHRGHRRRPLLAGRRRRGARRVARPGAGPLPVRRAWSVWRLRLPARRSRPPARTQGRGRRRAAAAARPPRPRGCRRARAGRRRRPPMAHPRPLRADSRRPPRDAQAPLPRPDPRRRLPDRHSGRRGAPDGRRVGRSRRRRPPLSPSPTTASGRCIPAPPACWSRRCWRCSTHGRGSGSSTSMPASGSSAPSSPTASARTASWPSRATSGRPAMPPPTCRAGRGCCVATSAPSWSAVWTSPSTWSSSTRPAKAPAGPSWSRSPTGRPEPWRTSPATRPRLARDVAIFAEHGYELVDLRAFDLFPMTHHVECVALLTRG